VRAHRVVIGLVAGLILGSVIQGSNSPALAQIAGFIEPFGLLWLSAIRMTVVPLVVSLLFVSVAMAAENDDQRQIVLVTIATFFGLLLFAAAVAILIGPPLIEDMKLGADIAATLRSTATNNASDVAKLTASAPGIGSWLTSLVPANAIKAAADGAIFPLILFTVLFALAARRIERSLRDALTAFFAAVANAMTRIVGWIIALAPVGIFALVVGAASRAGAALAGVMGYYVVSISAALVLFALLMYPVASTIGRIPLGWFTRAVLPAQAIALSSSSSLASLPALIEGARALELPAPATGFVLPLSVSAFKVATPITWVTGTLFLAKVYGVALGTTAVITVAIAAVALSFVIPGVPRGAQLMLAPLLARYGIPVEGIALLIAVDVVPDLIGTMTNVTGDLVVAAVVARLGVAEEEAAAASSPDA
jgi:proton glutamate symport protein